MYYLNEFYSCSLLVDKLHSSSYLENKVILAFFRPFPLICGDAGSPLRELEMLKQWNNA